MQGVFFRANTVTQAENLGVKGFVRNEPDGTVYIEAEGTNDALAKFTAWCKRGPTFSRVDNCEIIEGTVMNFTQFEIKR